MESSEKFWLAGIFEGEGSCGIYGPYGYRGERVMVSLGSTDKDVVETVRRVAGVGKINHRPLSQKNPAHRDQWVWCIQNARDALAVCEVIYPHLHARRQAQMLPVLAWCRARVADPPRRDVSSRERDQAGRFAPSTQARRDVAACP